MGYLRRTLNEVCFKCVGVAALAFVLMLAVIYGGSLFGLPDTYAACFVIVAMGMASFIYEVCKDQLHNEDNKHT